MLYRWPTTRLQNIFLNNFLRRVVFYKSVIKIIILVKISISGLYEAILYITVGFVLQDAKYCKISKLLYNRIVTSYNK